MNSLNSLILEGNVVRQLSVTEPTSGFKVCRIPLAVNRTFKNSSGENVDEVSYFDVETYGKMAEMCEKFGTKGRGIRVVGRLKQNRWKDSEGKNASKVFVVAEHVEFKPVFNGKSQESKKDNKTSGQENNSCPEEIESEESVF